MLNAWLCVRYRFSYYYYYYIIIFSTNSQLNVNVNGLYLRNEARYRLQNKCVENYTMGLLDRVKTSWTLVHKRLRIGPSFYPPFVNYAFYFTATLRRRRSSASGTQPNSAKRWTANRANILPHKSRGRLSKKLGAKTIYLFGFSTTSRLNGEYLLNERWHRQSGMGVGKYEESPMFCKNSMNLVIAVCGPEILPNLRKFWGLLRCQALHTKASKRNQTKLCQPDGRTDRETYGRICRSIQRLQSC